MLISEQLVFFPTRRGKRELVLEFQFEMAICKLRPDSVSGPGILEWVLQRMVTSCTKCCFHVGEWLTAYLQNCEFRSPNTTSTTCILMSVIKCIFRLHDASEG